MSVRLLVRDQAQPLAIVQGAVLTVPANKWFSIEGLDPGSDVTIREFGDHRWRHRVVADQRGVLKDAQKTEGLGTHEQGGAEYEVGVRDGGRELVFRLRLEFVHGVGQDEVEVMVRDLRHAGFRWDASSPVPTRTGDLERHVEEFERAAIALSGEVVAVLRAPDDVLVPIEGLVGVRTARRMAPASVRRNLREGRLDPDGVPLSRCVHATVDQSSVDTGANAYVAHVVAETRAIGAQLASAISQEEERLTFVRHRELRHHGGALPAERGRQFDRLYVALSGLRDRVLQAPVPHLPDEWRTLRSNPDPAANAVRFDPRYRAIHERRAALTHGTPAEADRLQRIAAFGRRPQNAIYEYWVVAKVLEVLQRMGFAVAMGSTVGVDLAPLRQLERHDRGTYELTTGGAVHLVHAASPHLAVAVGYEAAIAHQGEHKTYTPDVAMSLRGTIVKSKPAFGDCPYDTRTLFWDAKFRNLHKGWDTYELAHKYVDLREGAQAHLLHLGEHEAWARRLTTDSEEPARQFGRGLEGLEAMYPYRVGWSRLRPTVDTEAARAMQQVMVRVVFSWLVRQGVVCICPRCGGRLETTGRGMDDARAPFRPHGSKYPRKRHVACDACGLAMTATFCGSCRSQGTFTPIVKVYPRPGMELQELTDDWSQDFEIAERAADYRDRVCPRCGKGFGFARGVDGAHHVA